MAGNMVLLQMEEQWESFPVGSDHMRALIDLKSRFHRLELEVESESSLSSSVKLQCPKLEHRFG